VSPRHRERVETPSRAEAETVTPRRFTGSYRVEGGYRKSERGELAAVSGPPYSHLGAPRSLNAWPGSDEDGCARYDLTDSLVSSEPPVAR